MPDYTNNTTGWTVQQNPDLETGGGASSATVNPASQDGYIAQSILVEDAIQAVAHTSLGFLTRVYVPGGGVCTHVDYVAVTGTPNVQIALYSQAGPTGAAGLVPLVYTAVTAQAVGLNSFTWNGASSASSINLTAGTYYYLYSYHSTTSTLAACTGASAASMNPNLTVTTGSTEQLTSAITSVTNTTLLTAATFAQSKFWFGLR